MHVPAHFAEHRLDVLHDAVDELTLGTLVTVGDEGLEATPVPFVLDRSRGPQGTLVGHLARANRQWARAGDGAAALVTFLGPHGYVSPSAYPSKHTTGGRVVPTWNYVTVQVHGTLVTIEDRARVLEIVTALTDRHEAGRPHPWSVSDAPAEHIEAMRRGIVGIEVPIASIVGKWKLSQNRPPEDRAGIAADLAGTPLGAAVAAALTQDPAGRGTLPT